MKNLRFNSFLFLAITVILFSACDEVEPPIDINLDPEILTCNSFQNGTSLTLVDDPDKSVDYIVDCKSSVSVDLVIEPGVVIEFENDAGLSVADEGSISAIGTADKPIILTGVDKVAGSWKGLLIYSNDVKNALEHVTISYGGGSAFNSNDNKANLILWAQSRATIDNCTFSYSPTFGIEMVYQEYTIPSFTNNKLTNNNVPLYITGEMLHMPDASSDFTGNTNDYIQVSTNSVEEGNYIWRKTNVPFRVDASSHISIKNNTNVTIEPGVRFDFGTNSQLSVNTGCSLKAIGTSTEPIIFSGVDGAAGAWKGLEFRFTQSINNQLDNCVIEYAGSDTEDAAIYMWAEPKLSVTNCIIRDVDGCAFVDGTGTHLGFDNPNFSQSGNTFENVSGGVECI